MHPRIVTRIALAALLCFPAFSADIDLPALLKSVETHYNGVRTLQVTFEESLATPGRPKRIEYGQLYLRKPGRMRWDYQHPAGKIFLSDGKQVYYYNAANNRAEKMKLRETEDMRAPLAFLLGRLDFDKDFTNFTAKQGAGAIIVSAVPKSDKLPYRQVEFEVTPQSEIRRLVVTGQDNSLLAFQFRNERMNPVLDNNMFKFELPPGAQWVDAAPESQ